MTIRNSIATATLGLAALVGASENNVIFAGDNRLQNDPISVTKTAACERLDFDLASVKKYGFNQVYKLEKNQEYTGNADHVILVWAPGQVEFADSYRKAHYSGKTDFVVCEDPKVQRTQLGKKCIIYHVR